MSGAPAAQEPGFCTFQPAPGDVLKTACPECGHGFALHIGVEHCPVCELVELNRQAREALVTEAQVLQGEKSLNDYRAARGLPPAREVAVTVHFGSSVLDRGAVARTVRDQLNRLGRRRPYGRT